MSSYIKLENDIANEDYQEPSLYPFEIALIERFQFPCDFGPQTKSRYFPTLQDHFLAHGSYGACSNIGLECCHSWSALIEINPVHFFYNILYPYS